MQDLKVIGVEEGALLVASDEGARYRVAVDDVLQSRLRQSSVELGASRKLSPREIQTHIRAGMSAEDVSAVTGAPLDYVQRFEGPVLAEREFVIQSALNVPVHTAMEVDPLAGGATFGGVIRRRLVDAGALNERWASWKEEGGSWIVKLTFVTDQIDRDARWSFEPKKSALVAPEPRGRLALAAGRAAAEPRAAPPRRRRRRPARRAASTAARSARSPTAATPARCSSPSSTDASAPSTRPTTRRSTTRRPARPPTRPPTCSRRCAAAVASAIRWTPSTRTRSRRTRRPVPSA